MLRRIKAIYFYPVFILLFGGGVYAGWKTQVIPAQANLGTAISSWKSDKQTLESSEKDYDQALKDQVDNSNALINKNRQFHALQATMPNIVDIKDSYTDQQQALRVYYTIMGKGLWITELNKWVKGFHLQKPPKFVFDPKSYLLYEDSLPSATFISVNFDKQTIRAKDFNSLLHQVQSVTGYGNFPLFIQPAEADKPVEVTIDSTNPNHKVLTMDYSVTGYFMTRGWDPLTDSKKEIDTAKALLKNPPKKDTLASISSPCPLVLWFIKPDGVDHSDVGLSGK